MLIKQQIDIIDKSIEIASNIMHDAAVKGDIDLQFKMQSQIIGLKLQKQILGGK